MTSPWRAAAFVALAFFGGLGSCGVYVTTQCWEEHQQQRVGARCADDDDCDGICWGGVCDRDPDTCHLTAFIFLPSLAALGVALVTLFALLGAALPWTPRAPPPRENTTDDRWA